MKSNHYKIAGIIFLINTSNKLLLKCKIQNCCHYDWEIIINIKKGKEINNQAQYEVMLKNRIGYTFDDLMNKVFVDTISSTMFLRTFFTYPIQKICFKLDSFIIHASSCYSNGKILEIFMGDCGVGKTTICRFMKNYFKILSDDGVRVSLLNNHLAFIPTAPFIKINKSDKTPKKMVLINENNNDLVFRKANLFVIKRTDSELYSLSIIEDYLEKKIALLSNIKNIFNTNIVLDSKRIISLIDNILNFNFYYLFIPDTLTDLEKNIPKLSKEIMKMELK